MKRFGLNWFLVLGGRRGQVLIYQFSGVGWRHGATDEDRIPGGGVSHHGAGERAGTHLPGRSGPGAILEVLGRVVEQFRWKCHAYCLMDNHYHLLVETEEGNLSRGMRQLNGIYTQTFNRRHGRVGHVLQGRYKAILVEKGRHLLELCRYVVLNPARAGAVKTPGAWKWSSYRATAGTGRDRSG